MHNEKLADDESFCITCGEQSCYKYVGDVKEDETSRIHNIIFIAIIIYIIIAVVSSSESSESDVTPNTYYERSVADE